MFLDIGPLEMLTLLVVAVVVLGPDKLPGAVSETASLVRKVRSFSADTRDEIRKELDPEFTDLHLHDLGTRVPAEEARTGTDTSR